MSDYLRYRGKCKEMAEDAVKNDQTLRLVRGTYIDPVWRTEEAHWWAVRDDGTIVDPSAMQFPSKGCGEYFEFDGTVYCSECGLEMKEEDVATYGGNGHYAFCSDLCYGRFVGAC